MEGFVVYSGGQCKSFRGYTLIAPSVSVGNVPQLTVDLILNTLKLERVGWINDDSLLPVVGNDALDFTRPAGYLHTGAEVYSSSDLELVVLQIRSPIAKGFNNSFCKRLFSWCESVGIGKMVALSSSHSHERLDGQMMGSQFRFLSNSEADSLSRTLCKNHNWIPLEMGSSKEEEEERSLLSSRSMPFLSGSGFAKQLHQQSFDFKCKFFLINMFCSQGDNIPDAVAMANHLNSWLNLVTQERQGEFEVWIPPQSWSAVYGGSHPRTLY